MKRSFFVTAGVTVVRAAAAAAQDITLVGRSKCGRAGRSGRSRSRRPRGPQRAPVFGPRADPGYNCRSANRRASILRCRPAISSKLSRWWCKARFCRRKNGTLEMEPSIAGRL